MRTCGHLAVANTMALKIAGVTTKSPVPAGGAIEQVNGDLTGLMAENGRQPVQVVLPAYTDEDHVAAIERGAKYMNTFGITSTMDAAVGMRSGYREIISYRNAVRTGRQPIRVTQCLLDIPDGILGRCHEEGLITGSGDDMLRVGPVKIFTDGSAGGKTAAMTAPYSGEEQTHGIYCLTDKEMEEATMAVHAKGYQLAVHAIGDGAIEQTLVAMEKALAKYPDADRRHRIEHCGFNTMDQMKRMRAAGIEPVPQPVFIYDFGELYQQVMPDERPAASYPMKTWIDMGFRPAASTDAPVCDANVWPNFFTMITRKTHKGTVIGGDQVISIERAIQAYTEFGAYVNKCEDHRGTLRPAWSPMSQSSRATCSRLRQRRSCPTRAATSPSSAAPASMTRPASGRADGHGSSPHPSRGAVGPGPVRRAAARLHAAAARSRRRGAGHRRPAGDPRGR